MRFDLLRVLAPAGVLRGGITEAGVWPDKVLGGRVVVRAELYALVQGVGLAVQAVVQLISWGKKLLMIHPRKLEGGTPVPWAGKVYSFWLRRRRNEENETVCKEISIF